MKMKLSLSAGLLAVTLFAQTQTETPPQPPAQTPPASQASAAPQRVLKESTYVRRVSAGATLSVLTLTSFSKRTINVVTTTPVVDALYTTVDASQRIGYGLTAQLAVSERIAVNASLLVRRAGYQLDSDIFEGTDNPATSADDRKHTVRHEDTRMKFYDLPVVFRYYLKDRHEPGPRGFLEIGGVARRAAKIRTSISTQVGSGNVECCTFNPAQPAHRTARGVVAGAGLQLIDPVGIRVVPEVRYTRWLNQSFSNLSTGTRRDQIEAMISLTF